MSQKYRKLKLTPTDKTVLLKIKKRQVKNVERTLRIGGHTVPHPTTGKPVTATYVNISNAEAARFWSLHKRGLVKIRKGASRTAPAFTDFLITPKGKAQLNNPCPSRRRKRKRKR